MGLYRVPGMARKHGGPVCRYFAGYVRRGLLRGIPADVSAVRHSRFVSVCSMMSSAHVQVNM